MVINQEGLLTSISIIAEDEQMRAVDFDAKAMQLADVSTDVYVEKSGKGELTFKGKQSLVFGVELYELLYDTKEKCFRFNTVRESVRLRDRDSRAEIKEDVKPAFIGDANEGNAFLTIVEKE